MLVLERDDLTWEQRREIAEPMTAKKRYQMPNFVWRWERCFATLILLPHSS